MTTETIIAWLRDIESVNASAAALEAVLDNDPSVIEFNQTQAANAKAAIDALAIRPWRKEPTGPDWYWHRRPGRVDMVQEVRRAQDGTLFVVGYGGDTPSDLGGEWQEVIAPQD